MPGPANERPSRKRQVKLAVGGILILLAVFLVFVRTAALDTEAGPQLLGPENWSVTVEETVSDLLPRISWFVKLKMMLMKKEDTISLHFELGTGICNRYGLWRGNDKLILSACGYRCDPEEASMKIIEAVWRALHK